MILGDGFWCVFSLSQWALKKSLNFIFPTKYVIPKSLKFSHWPSKFFLSTQKIQLKKNTLWFLLGLSWDRSAQSTTSSLPTHTRAPTTWLVQLHLVIPKDLSHKLRVVAGSLSRGFTQNPVDDAPKSQLTN